MGGVGECEQGGDVSVRGACGGSMEVESGAGSCCQKRSASTMPCQVLCCTFIGTVLNDCVSCRPCMSQAPPALRHPVGVRLCAPNLKLYRN